MLTPAPLVGMLAWLSITASAARIMQTADYDEIKGVNPAVGFPPPAPYKNLTYHDCGLGAPVQGTVALQAASPPNAIFAPYPLPTGQLSIKIADDISYFDMKSIAAGCYLATQNGLAAPPVGCTIEFTGTKTDGKTVKISFTFDAGEKDLFGIGLAAKKMQDFVFPTTFTKLVELRPRVVATSLGSGKTANMGFDNLGYNAMT